MSHSVNPPCEVCGKHIAPHYHNYAPGASEKPQAPAAALTADEAAAERFLYDDKELEAFSRNGFCVGARWQREQDQAELRAQAERIDAVLRLCDKYFDKSAHAHSILVAIRAALQQPPDAEPLRFELRDDCALTLFPSSKEGYETLTLLQGDDVLEIQLTPEAKVALAMTVESEPRERVTDASRLERLASGNVLEKDCNE